MILLQAPFIDERLQLKSFFPDGSGTSIPIYELIKGLRIQTNNAFHHSAKSTVAANEARRLISLIRSSLQDISKSASIPLYSALVLLHLECGILFLFTIPHGRLQPFEVNSDNSHSPHVTFDLSTPPYSIPAVLPLSFLH